MTLAGILQAKPFEKNVASVSAAIASVAAPNFASAFHGPGSMLPMTIKRSSINRCIAIATSGVLASIIKVPAVEFHDFPKNECASKKK